MPCSVARQHSVRRVAISFLDCHREHREHHWPANSIFGRVPADRKNRHEVSIHGGLREWSGADLNRRHMDFQSIALPTELPDRASKRRARGAKIARPGTSVKKNERPPSPSAASGKNRAATNRAGRRAGRARRGLKPRNSVPSLVGPAAKKKRADRFDRRGGRFQQQDISRLRYG